MNEINSNDFLIAKIDELEQQLEEAVEVIEKAKFSSGFFIDDLNSKDTYLSATEFLAKYRGEK